MASHSSILAWRIPWTEEPGGLQSRVSQSQTRLKQLSMLTQRNNKYLFEREAILFKCINCPVLFKTKRNFFQWSLGSRSSRVP